LAERGVSLAIGLFILGVCLYSAWNVSRREAKSFGSVQTAMHILKPFSRDDQDIETILENSRYDWRFTNREPLISYGRLATLVAAQIENHNPGDNKDVWRKYAVEMRDSASQLSEASRRDDRLAMLAAARRLDASCQKCHEVFRPRLNRGLSGISTSRVSAESRLSRRPGIFLTRWSRIAGNSLRERISTRDRIRSYAVGPIIGAMGSRLESTNG
jgi:hypothetical protein